MVTASRLRRVQLLAGVMLLALGATIAWPQPADAQGTTLLVPADYATIQEAVDAAGPGDTVLVANGTYHEAVFIGPSHPGDFTIRGETRNGVILDGQNELGTAIEAQADDVVMENMTAHDYTGNGFYWQSVDGYRGSYLTAYRIGVYAIFSFDAVNGIFEHSYASGSADAAYYVGQCFPCNTVLRDLTAEYSALGYSGTNAGGNLILENSLWQNNGAGILPNSLSSEANPPQRQATIRNNVVRDNNNLNTPATGLTGTIVGIGIGLAGGHENIVENNLVQNHDKAGIAIFPLPESIPDTIWFPAKNQVLNNTVENSGLADLALAVATGFDSNEPEPITDQGNCFSGNTFATSDPPLIETVHGCELGVPLGTGAIVASQMVIDFVQATQGTAPDRPSYTTMPDAPPQPDMPGSPFTASGADAGQVDDENDDSGGLPATGGGVVLGVLGLALAGSASGLRRRA